MWLQRKILNRKHVLKFRRGKGGGGGGKSYKRHGGFYEPRKPLMKGIIELRSGNCRIQCFRSLIPTWQPLNASVLIFLIWTRMHVCVSYIYIYICINIYASPTPAFNLAAN